MNDFKKDGPVFALNKQFNSIKDYEEYFFKWLDEPIDLEYFKKFLSYRLQEAENNALSGHTNRTIYRLLGMAAFGQIGTNPITHLDDIYQKIIEEGVEMPGSEFER